MLAIKGQTFEMVNRVNRIKKRQNKVGVLHIYMQMFGHKLKNGFMIRSHKPVVVKDNEDAHRSSTQFTEGNSWVFWSHGYVSSWTIVF